MRHQSKPFIELAQSIGFESVGIVQAQRLEKEALQLEQWLANGFHGEMTYMERYFDLRIDPTKLLEGCKSVIMMTLNYDQPLIHLSEDHPKVSKYAYGQDYHRVIKDKCELLLHSMRELYGDVTIRAFVDSGPIMERVWAEKSGLGWNGKNTLTINPKKGSYFFLACILVDLEFEYTTPIKDHCGTCKKCIEACPTQAIHPDGYLLDASKCISYLTIELKNSIPEGFKDKMNGWAFGCDICQEVCPWNRFSKPTEVIEFQPNLDMLQLTKSDWLEMNDETWKKISRNSPIKRTKREGMMKNIKFIS